MTFILLLFVASKLSLTPVSWCGMGRFTVVISDTCMHYYHNYTIYIYIYIYTLLTVPPPSITITGSPMDEDFHIGLLLTFSGRAEFNQYVDTPLTVDSSWDKTNPPSNLSNADITTAMEVGVSPTMYETNLTVNLMDTVADSGDYSVTFSVPSGPFTVGTVSNTTRPIIVLRMSILYVLAYIT